MAAAPPSVLSEYQLWEDHWCRCAQELGQWDTLNDFGKSQDGANPFLGEKSGAVFRARSDARTRSWTLMFTCSALKSM